MSGATDGKSQFNTMVWFMGVIEDINDPLTLNRVRVRCIGYHTDNKALLPTENLPWAPFLSAPSAMSAPIVNQGDWVVGFFVDGEQAQQPIVLGSFYSIPVDKPKTNKGFYDPKGKHPKHLNEGTNPRHARGDPGSPNENAVAYTRSSTVRSVPTAANSKFSEPESAFAAIYPANHVMETDGGHCFELDDTPGAERVQLFHKRGTFFEFHPDGTSVYRTAKNNFQLVIDNNNVYVGGNCNISAVGNVNILSGSNMNISTNGNVNWRVGGTFNLDIGKDMNVVMNGSTRYDIGGGAVFYAKNNIYHQARQVHLNSGVGKPLGIVKPPDKIQRAKAGPTSFEIIAFEDDRPKTFQQYSDTLVQNGFDPLPESADPASPAYVPPAEGESSTPPAGGEKKEVKCGNIVDTGSGTRLSKSFTLSQFTQGGSRPLQDQFGTSADTILCNLVKLCENILEPIKAAGMNFTITSAYRRAGDVPGSSPTSDHYYGRAVDIQVSGMSQYEAATKIYPLVGSLTKQFLLEYTSGGGAGWIHLAYADGSKGGLPLATFNNHSVYARGQLVNLRA